MRAGYSAPVSFPHCPPPQCPHYTPPLARHSKASRKPTAIHSRQFRMQEQFIFHSKIKKIRKKRWIFPFLPDSSCRFWCISFPDGRCSFLLRSLRRSHFPAICPKARLVRILRPIQAGVIFNHALRSGGALLSSGSAAATAVGGACLCLR